MPGFGSGPFGGEPFGEFKWSRRMLFEWTGQSSGHLVATVGRLPAGNFGEVLGSAAPKPCNRSRRAAARSEARTRAALTSESRIRLSII